MMEGWATITQLAVLRGRNKAAISRRVARMERDGLLRSKRGPNGTKLVNVAEFARLADDEVDAINEANGSSSGASQIPSSIKSRRAKRSSRRISRNCSLTSASGCWSRLKTCRPPPGQPLSDFAAGWSRWAHGPKMSLLDKPRRSLRQCSRL
jgi:hypothetical protein